jgi:hypothetical protein
MDKTTAVQALGGPACWHGSELRQTDDWVRPWSQACLDQFDRALETAERAGLLWYQVTRSNFALEPVRHEIEQIASYLEDGRGLTKLTGLALGRYELEQLKMLFFGLGSWLGRPVYQSAHGELLGEICDEGATVGATRGQMLDDKGEVFYSSRARAQSAQPLRWHTDRSDVVGLLCVGKPASGGVSRIASAVAIHDEMVRQRPDLAAVLYEDLERSHLGEEAGGGELTYAIPVWGVRDGKFATHYSRTYVEAAQKLPDAEKLAPVTWEALDFLAALGEELCFEMVLEPGDIQFINNHVVYHARSAFQDDPDTGRRRLLYRIWLSMENTRELPLGYEVLFGTTESGAMRGGIVHAESGVAYPSQVTGAGNDTSSCRTVVRAATVQ